MFGDEDGVFEVVVVLGYEGDDYVMAECQVIQICGWVISNDVIIMNCIIYVYDWMLVDIGGLIGMLEF